MNYSIMDLMGKFPKCSNCANPEEDCCFPDCMGTVEVNAEEAWGMLEALQSQDLNTYDDETHVVIPKDMAKSWLESLEELNNQGVVIWPNHPFSPISYLRKAITSKGE